MVFDSLLGRKLEVVFEHIQINAEWVLFGRLWFLGSNGPLHS